MHKHITKGDRACIAALIRRGESHGKIAAVIGAHRTSVGREIARNSNPDSHYDVCRANKRAAQRRSGAKTLCRVIDTDVALKRLVHSQLKKRLSPEQIEGRFGGVSFMSIYRYVERHPHLRQHLRRRGRRRRRYGTRRIPSRYQANKRTIHERPVLRGLGHWEGDTIIGKERTWSIVTYVDKISGYLIACRVRHTADAIHAHATQSLKNIPCDTITYDNGSEFALHQMIEWGTGASVYFADVGCPYQRPTNENTNGLVRDYFPKGTAFATITNNDVQRVVRSLNNRPRKRLNYLTPREVFKNGGVRFKC